MLCDPAALSFAWGVRLLCGNCGHCTRLLPEVAAAQTNFLPANGLPDVLCSKCQSSARDRWLLEQASSLLPVSYAQIVISVPEQLATIAFRSQRLFYNLMFRAASETLLKITADPRHLGAHIGAMHRQSAVQRQNGVESSGCFGNGCRLRKLRSGLLDRGKARVEQDEGRRTKDPIPP
jgi:hypothetical protein